MNNTVPIAEKVESGSDGSEEGLRSDSERIVSAQTLRPHTRLSPLSAPYPTHKHAHNAHFVESLRIRDFFLFLCLFFYISSPWDLEAYLCLYVHHLGGVQSEIQQNIFNSEGAPSASKSLRAQKTTTFYVMMHLDGFECISELYDASVVFLSRNCNSIALTWRHEVCVVLMHEVLALPYICLFHGGESFFLYISYWISNHCHSEKLLRSVQIRCWKISYNEFSLMGTICCRKREVNKKVLKVPEIEVKVRFNHLSVNPSHLSRANC